MPLVAGYEYTPYVRAIHVRPITQDDKNWEFPPENNWFITIEWSDRSQTYGSDKGESPSAIAARWSHMLGKRYA